MRKFESCMKEHGLGGQSVEQILKSQAIDEQMKTELRKFKNRRWHGHLDDCHGKCVLRRDDVRSDVAKALLHFDSVRYDVERFVIMPNHVHVLMQMRHGFLLRKELENFLRYSARTANRILVQSCPFWQTGALRPHRSPRNAVRLSAGLHRRKPY